MQTSQESGTKKQLTHQLFETADDYRFGYAPLQYAIRQLSSPQKLASAKAE